MFFLLMYIGAMALFLCSIFSPRTISPLSSLFIISIFTVESSSVLFSSMDIVLLIGLIFVGAFVVRPRLPRFYIFLALLCTYGLVINIFSSQLESSAIFASVLQQPPFRSILVSGQLLLSGFIAVTLATNLSVFKPTAQRSLVPQKLFIFVLVLNLGLLLMHSVGFEAFVRELTLMTSKDYIIENGIYRPSAFFLEPRYFGVFCSIGVFFALSELIYNRRFGTFGLFGLLIISLIGLIVSQSLSALAGLAAGFCMVLYGGFNPARRIDRPGWILSLVIIILSLILITVIPQIERFQVYFNQIAFLGNDESALSTIAAIQFFIDNPLWLLTGVGFGNLGVVGYDYLAVGSGYIETGFTSTRVFILDFVGGTGMLGFFWIVYFAKALKRNCTKAQNIKFLVMGLLGVFLINSNFVGLLLLYSYSKLMSDMRLVKE